MDYQNKLNQNQLKKYSFITHEYRQVRIDRNEVPIIPHYQEIIKAIDSLNHDALKEIIKRYHEKNIH
jgi:hypothetical protein